MNTRKKRAKERAAIVSKEMNWGSKNSGNNTKRAEQSITYIVF